MSEQQPLLPRTADDTQATTCGTRSRREKAVHVLEDKKTHLAVIALISIDAICVLADLIFTVLSPDCTPPDELPTWLEVLSHISLVITSLFVLEIPITLWASGARYYQPFGRDAVTHASLHLFDALIILTTFVLEVVLKGREREVAGLLIILRLWRLIKLVGGIAVGAGELSEEQAKELEEVQQELKRTTHELESIREENHQLRRRLIAYEQDCLD